MFYLTFGIIVILVVLSLAIICRISFYSPLVLSALIWSIVFSVGFVYQDIFNPITQQAFLMWLIWFLITSIIYFVFSQPFSLPIKKQLTYLPFNYSLIVVGLILWLCYRILIVGSAGSEHFFLNLRLSSNQLDGFESLGLIERFYPLIFAFFLFENVNSCNKNRVQRFLLWSWMLIYAVATMGKFAVLTPVLAWLIIKGLHKETSIKIIIAAAIVSFLLMVALQFIRSGEDDKFSLSQLISIYIYSPIVALGYMEISPDAVSGTYVFRFIYAVWYALFSSMPPEPTILPYVEIPFETNVYTVLQPFVHDFGAIGVVIGATIYGIVFGALFWFAQKGQKLSLILYAALSIVIIGQFFGELLLTMFSGNLQLIVVATALVLFSKRATL